jgi:cation diffusion facilitator CzcD-associated flavoprotein CzcO
MSAPDRRTEARAAAILVVGGGAAGLSAAAALARRGHRATVLDRDDRIGGTWARRYERLRLHTARRFSGLAHHPLPRHYPRYVPKDLYARYLADYAARFPLDVRLGQEVTAVRHRPGAPGGLDWEADAGGATWRARAVVLATGHYAEPWLPPWEGRDRFPGPVLHSAAYASGRAFAGRRVLVVGLGNSGAEIAADLVECGAAAVSVAVRTPPPIVPRDLLGVVPVQLLGLALSPLGLPRLFDRLGAWLRRLTVGDLRPYGLADAAWGPFTARRPAVIDVGFLDHLKAGRLAVRPALARLTARGAVFADGTEEAVDAVVAATGYRTGLERILRVPGALGPGGRPAYPSARPTPWPGLYFTGFDESLAGHLFEANRGARRLAREIDRYLAPPVLPGSPTPVPVRP